VSNATQEDLEQSERLVLACMKIQHELEEAAKVCAGECARRLAIMTDQELAAAVEAARDMKREELRCALRRFLR